MRILMITDNYPHKDRPYITTFFHDHAKVLGRIGEVKVITLIRTNRFGYRRYVWEGIPVEAMLIPYVPRMGLIFFPLSLIAHTLLLLKNLMTFKPDAVVVHMGLPAGIPPAVLLKGRFILVEHSTIFARGKNALLSRFVMSRSGKVLAVSRFLGSEIERTLKVKVSGVLPNPVFGCSEAYPFKSTRRLLFVGRITPLKDPVLLKEAARLLPGYRFTFVGGRGVGWYVSEFLRYLPPNCEYLGPLPRDKVLELLRESDMLVSTSKYETFGVAIAEALSCGKPVVWTDSGGPRDFLNGRNSVLVKERTPSAFAEAIEEAYEKLRSGYFNPEEIRRGILSHASPERVAAIYRRFLLS